MNKLLLFILLALCVFLLLFRLENTPPAAHSWLTTGDERHLLEKQADKLLQDKQQHIQTIAIDKQKTYQQMEGFGAAMSGSSAYLLSDKLSGKARDALFADLFTEKGIKLSFLRHTIGASDYSVDANGNPATYTYADQQGPPEEPLRYFSTARDQTVITMLQKAKQHNPSLQIMGTPWTAPPWLKYGEQTWNGSYLDYTNQNTYKIYADYFVRYLKAYKQKGLPIDFLSVQNEPLFSTDAYPSMTMNAAEQRHFIQNYLGPALQNAGLDTSILAYDHNWDKGKSYAETVLNGASAYTAGTAFHCYEGDAETGSDVHQLYPEKGIYFTECSGGAWSTDFGNNLSWLMEEVIIGATRNWSKTVLMWNMALDEKNGPANGGCSNCRGVITVNSQTGAITKNVEYYALGHLSKFVQPGAVRISSTQLPNIHTVAFYDKEAEEIILLAANTSNKSEKFQLAEGAHYLAYTLPPQSAVTITWKASETK
ncbi:glycoside hydrolase family 30 beta sandwich domain-containing protein [Terribacillus sp. DMT04]|uniref:glycoside hydrolase family 30 protein n=1 Tax=Terribacillus sp. DMT04 TaxID=2850441 RepID=UPI001C2C1CA8|nr:glycoside hydrolase [Terribacillus sp. DMT04]QXE01019.1 beta-1,6-glucanase [Terribacillus sp. DMT04]